MVFTSVASAHPGRTASDWCHYCRTNCSKWWEVEGQRHCHWGSTSTPATSTYTAPKPIYMPPIKTPLEKCQDQYGPNAKVWTDQGGCECNNWYILSSNNSYCEEMTVYNSCSDSINWYLWADLNCYCSYGYEWDENNNKCKEIIVAIPSDTVANEEDIKANNNRRSRIIQWIIRIFN